MLSHRARGESGARASDLRQLDRKGHLVSATPSWSEPTLPPLTASLVSEPPISSSPGEPISPSPAEPAVPVIPFAAPSPAPAPAPEPAAPAVPAEPAPAPEPLVPAAAAFAPDEPDPTPGFLSDRHEPAPLPAITYRVLVRVEGGEQIEVAAHADGAAARDEATTLMRYLRDGRGDWPFVGGRFVRPDRIVSVDVEETRF